MLTSWFRREGSAAIGPLDSDQAEVLADLHASAFAQGWSALDFERFLSDRAVLADGLFLDGAREPAGFVLSRRVLDEAEILTVAIAPEHRGRGFSRPLLARHLDELRRRGVRRVHLEVEEGNGPALRLYRALGFAEVGRRAAYYEGPNGARASAIAMSAVL